MSAKQPSNVPPDFDLNKILNKALTSGFSGSAAMVI